jgi:hypothetical protein
MSAVILIWSTAARSARVVASDSRPPWRHSGTANQSVTFSPGDAATQTEPRIDSPGEPEQDRSTLMSCGEAGAANLRRDDSRKKGCDVQQRSRGVGASRRSCSQTGHFPLVFPAHLAIIGRRRGLIRAGVRGGLTRG